MKRPAWACVLLVACTWAAAAEPPAGAVAAGAVLAESERCVECHGREGQGDGHGATSHVRFAKLAGQHADYLLQQLIAFRGGTRRSDVMQLNVRHLGDAELRALAAWYASREPMRGSGAAASAPEVYRDSCAGCHDTPAAPRLAGQDERYLAQQLDDFRSGWRKSPLQPAMDAAAKGLSDAQIRALAHYLASTR